jgi:hypothetical protein
MATTVVAELLRRRGIYPLAGGRPAGPGSFRVANTCLSGTCAIAEWSGPGRSNYDSVGALHEGQPIDVVCQIQDGEAVTGANGDTSEIWDELDNGAFVADYYVNTPGAGILTSSIARCQGSAQAHRSDIGLRPA